MPTGRSSKIGQELADLGAEVDEVEVPVIAVRLRASGREQNLFQVLCDAIEGAQVFVDDPEDECDVLEVLRDVVTVRARKSAKSVDAMSSWVIAR